MGRVPWYERLGLPDGTSYFLIFMYPMYSETLLLDMLSQQYRADVASDFLYPYDTLYILEYYYYYYGRYEERY